MSLRSITSTRKRLATCLVAGVSVLALAACTSNEPSDDGDDGSGGTEAAPAGSNDEAGETVLTSTMNLIHRS